MKIQKKLLKDINKTLRNFNAKIRRLEKSGRDDIIIPERVGKGEFKEYETTRDIRRRLRQLSRFSRKGAENALRLEDGSYVSVWEKKEHDILKRTALSKISRQIKYYQSHKPRVYGKVQDVSFAKTGDEAYLRLISERNRLKTKGLLSRRQMEIENRRSRRIVEQKNHQFRENYYKMLDDIGSMLGQKDKVEQIKDQLDKLSDKDFVDFFNEDKGLNAVTFFYQTIEDGLFYPNYEYIKNNFDLMAEHLNDNFSLERYQELREAGFDKDFDRYAEQNKKNVKKLSRQYISDQNKYTSTKRKTPKRYRK